MSLSPELLGRRAGQLLLSITAVAGVVCALATIGALFFGVHPVIVRSGSMTPTIQTGSVAFGHEVGAGALKVGDVVTVPSGSSSVTHRIVDITRRADGKAVLRLKGDANNREDGQVYTVSSAKRELFSVPKAGFVVAWLSKAPGSYVIALYVVAMLLLIGRRGRGETPGSAPDDPVTPEPATLGVPDEESGSGHRPFAVLTAGAVLALGIAVVSGWGQSTWALWSDASSNSGTTLASGTWGGPTGTPTLSCGTTGKKFVNITWTAVSGATSYNIYAPNGTTLKANVLAPTLTYQLNVVNETGTVTVRAANASGEGPASTSRTYDVGNGSNNGTCS